MKPNLSQFKGNLTGKGGADYLIGTGLEGKILAGGGGDVLVGTSGSDAFRGGGGDDLFIGNGGGDQVFGNGGYDTYQVPGSVLNYAVWQQGPQHWKVTDLFNDVTSSLRHVEQIDFEGYSIVLTGVDNVPFAEDFSVAAFEDVTVEGSLSDHTWDLEGPLTYNLASVGTAQGGTVMVGGDGTWSYLSPLNFDGVDSFAYTVWDGLAGHDVTRTVTINVAAVADLPTLAVTSVTTGVVNEVALDVSAALTDLDGSESLSLRFSAVDAFGDVYDLAANGVRILDGTVDVTAGGIVDPESLESLVVVLPEGVDSFFDLIVTAQSTEASNGDTAETSAVVDIDYDYEPWSTDVEFLAENQNMWESGQAYVLEDSRFIGIDWQDSVDLGLVSFGADIRTGLQSDLYFNGGSVDANLPYTLHFDSSYNQTVDHLLIETGATGLAGGGFMTDSPNGSYTLDFVMDFYAWLGVDIEVWSDSWGFGFDETINLISIDSEGLNVSADLPFGLTATLAWPNIDTMSIPSAGDTYTAYGESEDFFNLNLDLDQALADLLLGGFNPVSWGLDLDIGVAGLTASFEIVDVDGWGGLYFAQDFLLDPGEVNGQLMLEDGSVIDFTYGQDVNLANASAYDVNNNGIIEFTASADPYASFTNDTDANLALGYSIAVLDAYVNLWYDIWIADDSWTWDPAPVWSTSGSADVASFDVYDETFDLDFAPETVYFMV